MSDLISGSERTGPSRADRFKATPKLKSLQQQAPRGYVKGRWNPSNAIRWRPFYKTDAGFNIVNHEDVWLPQVSGAMNTPFLGRGWKPRITFNRNAGLILDLMASILEPPAVQSRKAFERPLMYNPVHRSRSAESSSIAGRP